MLTVAITSFFTLALIGAILVIGFMFFEYQAKIKSVILIELGSQDPVRPAVSIVHHPRIVKARQTTMSRRPMRLAPMLRAAA